MEVKAILLDIVCIGQTSSSSLTKHFITQTNLKSRGAKDSSSFCFELTKKDNELTALLSDNVNEWLELLVKECCRCE